MTNDERELFDERVAIVAQSESEEVAQEVAREALERSRHEGEVKAVVRDYHRHGGDFVTDHLKRVAHNRGQDAANKLRADALAVIMPTMINQKLYRCSSPACDKDVKEEFIRKWPTADGRFRYLCVSCVEKRKTRKG